MNLVEGSTLYRAWTVVFTDGKTALKETWLGPPPWGGTSTFAVATPTPGVDYSETVYAPFALEA